MDDLILIGNDTNLTSSGIAITSMEFSCHDLGKLKYFLRMKANYYKNGDMMLSQSKYVMELLIRFNLTHCWPSPSLVVQGRKLNSEEGDILSEITE